MLWMPKPARRSAALGPMPLIFLAASGQMRVGSSSGASSVRPSGLSRSEQILASSLLGATPIEQLSPVASNTAAFSALGNRQAGVILRAGHLAQIDVDLVDAAVFHQRSRAPAPRP